MRKPVRCNLRSSRTNFTAQRVAPVISAVLAVFLIAWITPCAWAGEIAPGLSLIAQQHPVPTSKIRLKLLAQIAAPNANAAPVYMGRHSPVLSAGPSTTAQGAPTPEDAASTAAAARAAYARERINHQFPQHSINICGRPVNYENRKCWIALVKSLDTNIQQPAPDAKCAQAIRYALDLRRHHCN